MPLEPPKTLSPSKVSSFTSCGLAFKFSAIDKISEPPTLPSTQGTMVHAALERLFDLPPVARTLDTALECLDAVLEEMRTDPLLSDLYLDEHEVQALRENARSLVSRYFEMEDPESINAIGLELWVQAPIGNATVRGIIDRLELDADGGLVVTDYKTGKAPKQQYEASKQVGVLLYALLCEKMFGKRPSKIRLLYLGDGVEISTTPTDGNMRAVEAKAKAIWAAIERACERDDFRPKPSGLCNWCAFQDRCPAWPKDTVTAPA